MAKQGVGFMALERYRTMAIRAAVTLLLACMAIPTAAAQVLPPPVGSSLYEIDRWSAERSRERNDARRQSGAIAAAAGPYTVMQVDIPAADDGSGWFTGTGFMERIQIMTPFGYDPNGPYLPLVLVFNGFGNSAGSFFNGMSDIPDEANLRGWMCVAVTCLDDKSFGWVVGQTGVEVGLQYVLANYRADPDRVYGVGWSAGGGAIASYAARHLDPAKPMLAAIGTNAGTYDLVDVYGHAVQATKDLFEHPNLYGGPPTGATLWNYLRTQTETTGAGAVVPALSQLGNLRHVPTRHVYSVDDNLQYLPPQSQLLTSYLTAIGAPVTTQTFSGLPVPHTWDILDGPTTLAFFDGRTVERAPASFRVLADRDVPYYWALPTRRSQGFFGRVHCTLAGNDLTIDEVANLQAVKLSPPAPFDPNDAFDLSFSTIDAGSTRVILTGVHEPPTYVLAGTALFSSWTHFPGPQELVLVLPSGTSDVSVRFDDYGATLSGPAAASVGSSFQLALHGSQPNQTFILLAGLSAGFLPLSLFDPNDDRNLLLGLNPLPIVLPPSPLDASGNAALHVGIANPALVGQTIHWQFVTLPGATTLVDEISNRLDVLIQ